LLALYHAEAAVYLLIKKEQTDDHNFQDKERGRLEEEGEGGG